MDAIIEYLGSTSIKVIAHVKENGIEPIGSIVSMNQDNNPFERREDNGSLAIVNSKESRDGLGELSVLMETPKKLLKKSLASSRRKSLFRIFKRKGLGVGAVDSLRADEEASTISCKDNATLSLVEPSVVLYDEYGGGIGASYSISCLSGDLHDEK